MARFREEISIATVVHDEEEGVSLRLSILLEQPANRSKLAAARITHTCKRSKATGEDSSSHEA